MVNTESSRLARPGRLGAYGTTVFAEMSALAAASGAVNLGQGFPDEPGRGMPALLDAIADHSRRTYSQDVDPNSEILVTAGATEAIAASVLALCGAGDEVVTFEPFYDSYAATIELSGARRRVVPLEPADDGWAFDPEELRGAITPQTRMILLNTPHNPTGRVFSHDELALVAELCIEHDLLAVTDEVYEHLVFSGPAAPRHERLATFDQMRERTLTISSAGKTFSVTGWKIGWVIGPPFLVSSVTAVKQFLTFATGTPFQLGVAAGLRLPDDRLHRVVGRLQERRDQLCGGLESLGWPVMRPQATYFATVDAGALGGTDARQFCLDLVQSVGVAVIPMTVFYDEQHRSSGNRLVRFAFCKRESVIAEALDRLAKW